MSAEPGVSGDLGVWEAAYLRFETPEEEIRKFMGRLRMLGADAWPREARIVELFSGRGGGLRALERLGFTQLTGVDLSPRLVAQYVGPATCHVADCRQLPLADGSHDVAIVQGGLHHLPTLPDDLARVLEEVRRILRPGGLFVAVEPWPTPFLSWVHFLAARRIVRRLSVKIDALQTMIENERRTYEQWLGRPQEILGVLRGSFEVERAQTAWGKLMFAGRRR
jgi:SAM-dependent methyltransferase